MRLPLPCFLVSSASIPQTEISHSTGVKIRAALLLVGWLPVNLLCTGVQDSHTKHTPTYALSLTVHETCSFNWLHEWLSAQIMLSGKQENVEFPKKKTLHKLKSSSYVSPQCTKAVALNLWASDRMCLIRPRTSIPWWAASSISKLKDTDPRVTEKSTETNIIAFLNPFQGRLALLPQNIVFIKSTTTSVASVSSGGSSPRLYTTVNKWIDH